MITETQAKAIVENYAFSCEYTKQHLAQLMEFEGIDTLVYRVYTPYFNDGDPCNFTVEFIGKPNALYHDNYIMVAGDTFRCFEEGEVNDAEAEASIPTAHLAILQKPHPGWQDSVASKAYYEELQKLEPQYKLENFEAALHSIAEIILPTNQEGLIKLDGDTVVITAEGYDCGN